LAQVRASIETARLINDAPLAIPVIEGLLPLGGRTFG
jgi:hypothetical protein